MRSLPFAEPFTQEQVMHSSDNSFNAVPPARRPAGRMSASAGVDSHRMAPQGYSSPVCTCPRCSGPSTRVHRRLIDLIVSMFVTVSRFRCNSKDCGWKGNVRARRHPLLMQGR